MKSLILRLFILCLYIMLLTRVSFGQQPGDVFPLVNCVEFDASTNELKVYWSYSSSFQTDVDIPPGASNFFQPPPSFRGQPSTFSPGLHERVVYTVIDMDTDGPDIAWSLNGNTRTAVNDPRLYCHAPTLSWRGAWDLTTAYKAGDAVFYQGSSWRARQDNTNVAPVAGDTWEIVAHGGDKGDKGDPGTPGAQGPQGPAGNSNIFPSTQVYTFPVSSRLTIIDAHVTASSVITLQYVGGMDTQPIAIDIQAGRFTAKGLANKQFRYVVFN